MRLISAAVCLIASAGIAVAQAPTDTRQPGNFPHSTGRTVVPPTKGVDQPQGPTGPLNTTTGGAPASSPQGESPPGMQAAPEGSSKTSVEPKK